MKRRVDHFSGMRFAIAGLLAIAAAAMIAACGSSSSADGSGEVTNASAPAITKATLIEQADAICRNSDEVQKVALAAYEKEHPGALKKTSGMEEALTQVLIPPIAVEVEKVAALGIPSGDEAEVTTIVSGWETALKTVEKKPGILITLGEGPFEEPDKLAAKYGFKECDKAL